MCDNFMTPEINLQSRVYPFLCFALPPRSPKRKFAPLRVLSYRVNGLTQHFQQYIILRVGMAEMLPESFPISGIYPVTRMC